MKRTLAIGDPAFERDLMQEILDPMVVDFPRTAVGVLFPWGVENTALWNQKEPNKWICEDLEALGDHLRNDRRRVALGLNPKPFKELTSSGRGTGKSAKMGITAYYQLSCFLGTTVIFIANTEPQLKSRTWAEFAKWHTLAVNSHWFHRGALIMRPAEWFDTLLRTQLKLNTNHYYAEGQVWNADDPDAFAGVHNLVAGIGVYSDEMSGLTHGIMNVIMGFYTDPVIPRIFEGGSNPRHNEGPFYDGFHPPSGQTSEYRLRYLDSREVETTDKDELQRIVDKFGEDSDVARVEVLGQFPLRGINQFIARSLVEDAVERELTQDVDAPLILGVDVARSGDDSSVIFARHGRDARSIPPRIFKGLDNIQFGEEVIKAINELKPDAVACDAGNGTGVIDYVRHMKYPIHEVWASGKPNDPQWADRRTELFGLAREYLRGGCISGEGRLRHELPGPMYSITDSKPREKVKLESKKSMKGRGLPSPDVADAFAHTFAVNPARRDIRKMGQINPLLNMARGLDYNPLDWNGGE